MNIVITIDGPAASGKSTVSRELARRLGCPWVSTGAFYRGLAYIALQMGLDFSDVESLGRLARSPIWSVEMTAENTKVLFQGEDVSDKIAHDDVGSFASRISSYPVVRAALLEGQRRCFKPGLHLVAEGRDCGTVVFPEAAVKIYLTASSQNRAARRAQEQGSSEEQILKSQEVRDQQDSARKVAPLQIPDQALVVDTTNLSLDQAIAQVHKYVLDKISALA
ncbi:MAG: (d)CMP kinase [Bdellovibrionaceae bacterium]|nr:(d)CMP kinase [Pseudobdellovibrionaceae bacterium]